MSKPLVRVLVPCFNEEAGILKFYENLKKAFKQINDCGFEVLFINDGSSDKTLDVLINICAKNPEASYISFSRNFGKEMALSAGIDYSINYDAVIMIDADGQHPPDIISKFIDSWMRGNEIVIGTRTHTVDKSLVRRLGEHLFNTILGLLSGQKKQDSRTTDFRLLDKKVVVEFVALKEHNRITRGLIDWLGFKRDYVDFVAPSREFGKPTYNNRMLLRLALHAFVSQSTRPLKLIGALGIMITMLSILGEFLLLIYDYLLKDPYALNISGTFHAGMLIIFMVGLLLSCQGLIALYIENIYIEARGRPLYIISDRS